MWALSSLSGRFNRFRQNVENSPRNIRGYVAIILRCTLHATQVAFFLHQAMMIGGDATPSTTVGGGGGSVVRRQRRVRPQSVASLLLYRPDKQRQLWRFLLYMLVHAGYGWNSTGAVSPS